MANNHFLSIRLPARPSVRPSARPSVRPSVRPPARPSVRPSVRLSVWIIGCSVVCPDIRIPSHHTIMITTMVINTSCVMHKPRTWFVHFRQSRSQPQLQSPPGTFAQKYITLISITAILLRCVNAQHKSLHAVLFGIQTDRNCDDHTHLS